MTTGPRLNRADLLGSLAVDPAPVEYHSGGRGAELPALLEVVDAWTDRDGKPREQTNRIPIRLFRRDAEFVAASCRKGTRLLLHGPLRFDPDAPGLHAVFVARVQILDIDSSAAPDSPLDHSSVAAATGSGRPPGAAPHPLPMPREIAR